MRAVVYEEAGPIDGPGQLFDRDVPEPSAPAGRDLLVEVKAVSVNPVDAKVRTRVTPATVERGVLGWDAAGVVRAVGPEVTGFAVGDAVFYAGSIGRPGTNAALHLVDERIVGAKPRSLDWAEAAALPLTAITAWEALFDRLDVRRDVPGAAGAILVIGGAGGVASMAIQFARQLTGLTVIATASRPDTREWVSGLGAHHVIDHTRPLAPQVEALGLGAPGFVFSTTHTDQHLAGIAELIAPQGRLAVIDDPATLDISPFKRKSASVHWEFMFTRALFGTADIAEQGRLLAELTALVDAGRVRTTLTERLSPINAEQLTRAHRMIESTRTRGKIALEGWD